jgi:hypothetical protein
MTSAGKSVVKRAESEVESLTPPSFAMASDVVEDALPREEPMFGSLLGFYILRVNTVRFEAPSRHTYEEILTFYQGTTPYRDGHGRHHDEPSWSCSMTVFIHTNARVPRWYTKTF